MKYDEQEALRAALSDFRNSFELTFRLKQQVFDDGPKIVATCDELGPVVIGDTPAEACSLLLQACRMLIRGNRPLDEYLKARGVSRDMALALTDGDLGERPE